MFVAGGAYLDSDAVFEKLGILEDEDRESMLRKLAASAPDEADETKYVLTTTLSNSSD